MIEFSGEFSEKNKNFLAKKLAYGAFISMLVVTIPTALIIIVVSIKIRIWILSLMAIPTLFMSVFVLIFSKLPSEKKKVLEGMLPTKVVIDNDGTIKADWEKSSITKTIDNIRRINDYGEYYYISFKFPREMDVFCPKDMITQGTIEDFERIFKDKIIRKAK